MRVIPTNIIRERRDPLIVLKEKKSKITLLNPDKKLFLEVKVDGELYAVTETQERKFLTQMSSFRRCKSCVRNKGQNFGS